MNEINLDLDINDLKSIDMDLGSTNANPQGITVIKNSSEDMFKPNQSKAPSLGMTDSSSSNLGLDLLMNKKKKSEGGMTVFKSESSPPPSSPTPVVQSNDIKPVSMNNDLNVLDIDSKDNSLNDLLSDINIDSDIKLDNNDIFSSLDDNQSISQPQFSKPEPVYEQPKTRTFEEIQKEKFEVLCKIERLEERGAKFTKKFSMESDLDEMKYELDRVIKNKESTQSVKFQRKMLVAAITAIEFLNNKFDPFELKLDGWSESIHENVNDYDDIFEELHEKYKQKAHMAPELRLLLMLGGSGIMFHLTNTMFKSSLPGMGDIMKQNPDLMQQFAKAAVNTMGDDSGFGNMMGDMVDLNTSRRKESNGRKEMKPPPDIDSILGSLSDNNIRNINLDSASEMSESDIDVRNIEIGNARRRRNKKNEAGINLDV
jgi:hypothetical protein